MGYGAVPAAVWVLCPVCGFLFGIRATRTDHHIQPHRWQSRVALQHCAALCALSSAQLPFFWVPISVSLSDAAGTGHTASCPPSRMLQEQGCREPQVSASMPYVNWVEILWGPIWPVSQFMVLTAWPLEDRGRSQSTERGDPPWLSFTCSWHLSALLMLLMKQEI